MSDLPMTAHDPASTYLIKITPFSMRMDMDVADAHVMVVEYNTHLHPITHRVIWRESIEVAGIDELGRDFKVMVCHLAQRVDTVVQAAHSWLEANRTEWAGPTPVMVNDKEIPWPRSTIPAAITIDGVPDTRAVLVVEDVPVELTPAEGAP